MKNTYNFPTRFVPLKGIVVTMNFNKCLRCGCFFSSEDQICPNCQAKDEVDKKSLRNYLANNDVPESAESLAFQSGIDIKNINRFMQTQEFSLLKDSFSNINIKF